MFGGVQVSVVVPAYQESRLIGRTLSSMPDFVDAIFVVDDGSTDGTAELARAVADPRIEVCCHEQNQGVGAAIATGYEAALAAGAELTVVMAGDGQMDPQDLPALLAPLTTGAAEYTKGDRLAWPDVAEQMPPMRFLGNHVLSAMTRVATGLSIQDSQCGYTAATRSALLALRAEGMWTGYGYPNDVLGILASAGMRVRDVAVRPVYGDEKSGIGWRHALIVIPWVLGRVAARRARARSSALAEEVEGLEWAP